MSNELSMSFTVGVNNGSFKHNYSNNGAFTQNSQGATGGILSVTTSAVTVPQTGVTTAGWMYAVNLDLSNYLDIGPDSSGIVPMMRLKPGEFALLRLTPSIVLKAQAHTATCLLYYLLLAD